MARSPEKLDSSPVHGGPDGANSATRLAFDRFGKGEPMVLLHGQGFSRRSWDPVVDALSDHHDVIAVDLPGHGDSPRQPDGRGSAPRDLAVAVTELLDELGLDRPHVVGHSSGGWVALELGRLDRAGTITGLAPAGLWRFAPPHIRLAMRQFRLNAKIVRLVAPDAPENRLVRGVSMLPASGRPFSLPYEPVRTMVHDLATAPGFGETLRALESSRFSDGAAITAPVTIAFGSRDVVMLPGIARRRDQLPDHARWVSLPKCGHLQMFDDPDAVVELLLAAADPDRRARLGTPIR
jgi:pimeloyl-ACP methyl ester carboxylesterase